jgi:hypothetical protein
MGIIEKRVFGENKLSANLRDLLQSFGMEADISLPTLDPDDGCQQCPSQQESCESCTALASAHEAKSKR